MIRIAQIAVILAVLAGTQAGWATTNPEERITFYLRQFGQIDSQSASTAEVLEFVNKLASKRAGFRRDVDFLEHLFVKTHQRFLKHFDSYPSFDQTLNEGTYNCLTATALYAVMLDHFGFKYQIIETNYHIFLVAEVGQGNVLFETTDPMNGFVTSSQAIQKRIAGYLEDNGGVKSKQVYRYSFDLYNAISLDQIAGLLHYNESVAAYNRQELVTSVNELSQALQSYESPRIHEMSQLLLLAVMGSDLEAGIKERCLQDLYNICKHQFEVTASAQ